jgi:hypothetical protein
MLTERKIVFSCMRYIQGISRYQLQLSSLYDKITANNLVRFIDAFVNVIDLEKLGFLPRFLKGINEKQHLYLLCLLLNDI